MRGKATITSEKKIKIYKSKKDITEHIQAYQWEFTYAQQFKL